MKKALYLLIAIAIVCFLTGCAENPGTVSNETVQKNETVQDDEPGLNEKGSIQEYMQIDAEEAKRIMDTESGYIILDVRTEEEFSEGHIPDSVLIPDYEIRERAEQELPDKNQLILVYCRSGNRSKTASAILAELGYTRVMEFGGIRDWPYDTVK